MLDQTAHRRPSRRKTHVATERPPFERIALILQGGGAFGSYQAGVYQALAEANLHPDWVAGVSIGAINSALIAGNPSERRVERLREFWETVSAPPLGVPYIPALEGSDEFTHSLVNQARSWGALVGGAPGFFRPRVPPPFLCPNGAPEALSFYDVAPLRATLERLVDFDLINTGALRFSVGAVNIRTGNFVYFDSTTHEIRPEHVMASGSLPPGFPPTAIEGEHYWDGGLVSNTPLEWVLDSRPGKDTLAFQIDLKRERVLSRPAVEHPFERRVGNEATVPVMLALDLGRREAGRQGATGDHMLSEDLVGGAVEVDEVAGSNIDGADTEARRAGVNQVEIHQTFKGRPQRGNVVITQGFGRPVWIKKSRRHARLEKTGRAADQRAPRAHL